MRPNFCRLCMVFCILTVFDNLCHVDGSVALQQQGLSASRQFVYLLEERKNILKGRDVPNLLRPPIGEVLIVEEPNRDIRRILEERSRTKLEGRASPNLLKPTVVEIVIVEEPGKNIRVNQNRNVDPLDNDEGSDSDSDERSDSDSDEGSGSGNGSRSGDGSESGKNSGTKFEENWNPLKLINEGDDEESGSGSDVENGSRLKEQPCSGNNQESESAIDGEINSGNNTLQDLIFYFEEALASNVNVEEGSDAVGSAGDEDLDVIGGVDEDFEAIEGDNNEADDTVEEEFINFIHHRPNGGDDTIPNLFNTEIVEIQEEADNNIFNFPAARI